MTSALKVVPFLISFFLFQTSCSEPTADSSQSSKVKKQNVFDAKVKDLSGAISKRYFSVTMNAESKDVGEKGAIYIKAIIPDGTIFYLESPGKWILYEPDKNGEPPAIFRGEIPENFESEVQTGEDLTAYAGARAYIGYGLGDNPFEEFIASERIVIFYKLTAADH